MAARVMMIMSQPVALQLGPRPSRNAFNRRRKMKTSIIMAAAAAVLCAFVAPAHAAKSKPIKVTLNLITADGVGKSVGTITIKEEKDGVSIEPNLKDLPPGEHGFHVH